MRPRNPAERVSQARVPYPPQRAPDPGGQVDDADEETAIDPLEPDNEPTAIRPPICPAFPEEGPTERDPGMPAAMPARASRKTRFARGSSHGFGPGSLGRIGKYELREKLGRGTFGVVFTAHDPSLDRSVAVKILRPTHLTNQEIVQRFLQEARATARIAHPGIVTIHDCGQIETNLGPTGFIAMELLTGESLTSRLTRSGRLAPQAAVEIVRQVASALEMAHRVDVLHRDLKPDNIYLVPDPAMPSGERVKILDFGLAKLGREGHTQLQTVFGTPRYMSPEQGRSATQIDHRSDIYSLGCILFELVTNRLPFDGDVRQLLERHQRMPPPRARSFVPELPAALDNLIAEMLAKDPMQRPQTMGAVQRALQHAVSQAPVAEPAPLAPSELLVPEPQGPTTTFERPAPRKPSEPPLRAELPLPRRPSELPLPRRPSELPLPRRPSEPPLPRRPSEPAERPEIPASGDAGTLSGVVLVPAAPTPVSTWTGHHATLGSCVRISLVALALVLVVIACLLLV